MPSATRQPQQGRRRTPCLDCGRPCFGVRCEDHRRQYSYATIHWQTIRAARLALDHWTCQLAHPGCTGQATTVHLDPAADGDHLKATLDNTTSCCAHCHGVEDAPRSNGLEGVGGRVRAGKRGTVSEQPAGSKNLDTSFEAPSPELEPAA